jgi:hypothetical protein
MDIDSYLYKLPSVIFAPHWEKVKQEIEATHAAIEKLESDVGGKARLRLDRDFGYRHLVGFEFDSNPIPLGWRYHPNWDFYIPDNRSKVGKANAKLIGEFPRCPTVLVAAKAAGVQIGGFGKTRLAWYSTGVRLLKSGDLMICVDKDFDWTPEPPFEKLKASEFYSIVEAEEEK